MADIKPTELHTAAGIPQVVMPDGTVGMLQGDANGQLKTAGAVEPTNSGAAVEAWGDGAGAGKELAAAYADGDGGAVATDGKTNWVADCDLSAAGDTPVTSVEIEIQVSIDGTNYRTVQVKSIVGGTITLADGDYTRATGGAVCSFAFDFNSKGATHFKVRAKSTGGDPTNSAFLVMVRGAGV